MNDERRRHDRRRGDAQRDARRNAVGRSHATLAAARRIERINLEANAMEERLRVAEENERIARANAPPVYEKPPEYTFPADVQLNLAVPLSYGKGNKRYKKTATKGVFHRLKTAFGKKNKTALAKLSYCVWRSSIWRKSHSIRIHRQYCVW